MKQSDKILRTYLIVIITLCLSADLSAQTDTDKQLPQFLFPSFADGIIKTKKGEYHSFIMNYNTVEEKMIIEQKGVYKLLKNIEDIDSLYLHNRRFVLVGNIFYELLANGPAPFYTQHKSVLVPEGNTVGYGVKSHGVGPTDYHRFELGSDVVNIDMPANYTIETVSVNWVSIKNEMQKFNSERQLKKIFPMYEKELTTYFRENKVSFRSTEDLEKLGKYCNDLLNAGK